MTRGEVDELAENLDVESETVQEMEARMAHGDVPFDHGDEQDDEKFSAAPAGYLQDMRYNPERLMDDSDQETAGEAQLKKALSALDARSREIIKRRWLDEEKATLHDLAKEYGISAERIRQIESKALGAMKNTLRA